MKSEPESYSIDDLERDGSTHWDGVRNYQARNAMRDLMLVGDRVIFYHSNAKPPGAVGIAEVCKEAYPDFTAWDPKHHYFDAKSDPENPRWMMVDIRFVEKFERPVPLAELKENPKLDGMPLLQRGQRLSVQPVDAAHFDEVVRMAGR
ncbi:MAG: EVE domain-containing protein [Thermoplasmatota archaeon]